MARLSKIFDFLTKLRNKITQNKQFFYFSEFRGLSLNFNWNSELVDYKKYGFSYLPSNFLVKENILLSNLDSGENYITIRSIDQAGNYSDISNVEKVSIN